MAIKILSVDDSKTVRIIINKAFKLFDCQVIEAANGVEGLAAANKETPNLILLDITMPVMDGVEMLTRLKSDPVLKGIPVIMLTAEGGREQVLKIAKLGVRDYIVKPFKEDTLVEKVGKVVELKTKSDAPQKIRTIYDPANILVVDDKPAIVQQIQEGLKSTPWKIHGTCTTGEAIDLANKVVFDLILISLSLPEDGANMLFRLLRQNVKTKTCPIFGLAVKTDLDVQQKAQQVGFNQVVTKPIEISDLEMKITRALNLDTSARYYSIKDGIFCLRLPENLSQLHIGEVSAYLRPKVSEAVNGGVSLALIDLHEVKSMEMGTIKLMIQAMGILKELAMPFALIGNPQVMSDCRGFEDTRLWQFHASEEEAKAALSTATAAT